MAYVSINLAGKPSSSRRARKRCQRFFTNSTFVEEELRKLKEVPKLLKKYAGKLAKLWSALQLKYPQRGPEEESEAKTPEEAVSELTDTEDERRETTDERRTTDNENGRRMPDNANGKRKRRPDET